MNLFTRALVLFYGIYLCDAGYGIPPPAPSGETQSDVEAPAYVPSHLNERYGTKTGYSRRTYSGRKTSFSGTKTGYGGTKTGGYGGTKTGGYGGTKTGGYSESKTWHSSYGAPPSYEDFHKSSNQAFEPKCEPECKNRGICIDTNTCTCPPNFHGKFCEFEKKPCMSYPPLPINSMRRCSAEICTITCSEGHRFIDGTSVANMRCLDGQWRPTRADFTVIPDCEPECNPPCLNGGVCLAVNTCQCPEDFRGPQCQYSTSVCDIRKLAFNGGYKCFGDAESFSCKLNCASYSSPPAELYSCTYATGVFEPQPIPHCVFENVVVITPSNYHHSESSSYHEHHNSSESFEQTETEASEMESSSLVQESKHDHGSYGKRPVEVVVQDFTPKGGVCLTWAGVHYKTFDGKIYSFESPCQHILLRDQSEHKYTVTLKHGECKRQPYCPSELTVYLEDKIYVLSVGEDGTVVFRSSRRLIPIPASLPGIRVAMPSEYVIVNLDAAGVTLKWDTNNLIIVEGSVLLWNNTEGLCGSLDGNPENDFITKEGMLAHTKTALASSWQLNTIGDVCESNPTEISACESQTDENMKKAQRFCKKVFSKDKFRKCSKVMDVSMLLETCQWDYCACTMSLSPEECACSTVSVYAKECLRHGVQEMKNWRDADTCPMKCTQGKIYQSCGPDAQPSCAFPLVAARADNSSCVEGCFCPEGLLLEGGRCVPKSECPCRLRNKIFTPGSVVPKECNTCTCQAGEWTCSQVPCGARCAVMGDPHYSTFDGLRYDFMGHCTYDLMRSDNLTVEVENVACSGAISEAMNLVPYKGEGKPSCTKAVNVNYGGSSVHLRQGGYILVNGQEVSSLPVMVGDLKIRAASSLFIMVQLPNKVDLWWDGNTRIFVDVPPELHGKTKGLCGTFNLNQKDDFLTPEGDVEQSSLAFANKWKTREFCDDVDAKEPEHPCKAHVENKEAAEKYCSKLKSSLFEECHWHVDVEPYYESCLYDVCACADDVSRCLCPILGDYAMACAKSGVKIQWRYNVKECEMSCSGGQEYTVCADSCLRSCTDVALSTSGDCKPCCVEGCACVPGEVLDANNQCVPVGMCPCFHKGLQFKAGYKEIRAGRRERELCTCVGARWDCEPATPDQIQNYPPAEDIRNNCSAANHMEFTTCEIAEPLTCKNMHLLPSTTTTECRPGCQCKKGYVLDTASKKCVPREQCPCHHGARSYPDGHIMQEDCNTCECKSGKWACTSKKCSGLCAAWGDSHVVTFDGAEYDFEGVCTYLLAKGVMDGKDGFDVEIQNVPCGTTGATCSKSVTLRVGAGDVEEIVSLTKDAPLPDLSKLKRIKLRIAGAFVFLDVQSMSMSLQWDRGMRVYVKVDSMWQGRVKGLCGNYNSDTRDDFQTPGGGIPESSALIFADSWKLKTTCPKPLAVTDHCKQRPQRKDWATTTCNALKRHPFTLCHSEVPVSGYVSRCEADACACDSGADCQCVCTALAAYALLCGRRGVHVQWRSEQLCPMQCDEQCSTYDDCVSPCPVETCDNTLDYSEIKTVCDQDTCVEGCKPKKTCPEGQVYTNGSFTECVPRAKCRPLCMTLEDGREVLEGEIIEEDACHTCRCSKKHRVCTGQPCSTEPEETVFVPTTEKPHDEPLKCVSGWTSWISRGTPETSSSGQSIDSEPLPRPNELAIGSPMCNADKMTKIECRTTVNHKSAKETGLDAECSLEKGLVCVETANLCPDFEIRVYCDCGEEPFQCLNSDHPNYPHPTDCHKFYECTPEATPGKYHAVEKSCGAGMMYNPALMICDWPASVTAVRPECGNSTESTSITPFTTPWTEPSTVTTTHAPETPNPCPPGQVYSDCAYPCDHLCHHFKKTLQDKGLCMIGEKCVRGCVDRFVLGLKCEYGSRWRDQSTCVPLKDCTCYSDKQVVKPGGVVTDGCMKCQCLDNELHCDSSECVPIIHPVEVSTHQPYIFDTPHTPEPTTQTSPEPTTKTTQAPTTKTTQAPTTQAPTTQAPTTQAPTTTIALTTLLVKNTATPPLQCSPEGLTNLIWDNVLNTEIVIDASSQQSSMFAPEHAVLNGGSLDITAGSWNAAVQDTNQFIQVTFASPEPIYGVVMQGSPIFDQYVTSYEVMYGDDGHTFSTVDGPDGNPRVFRGPVDNRNSMEQMINPPIEARVVRIRPLSWHDEISVRFDLIGCREPDTVTTTTVRAVTTPEPLQCTEPLGLAADLPIESIEVSSNNDLRKHFALDGERGWKPAYSTPGEWIMFDFTSPRNITGIKTKGGATGWVSTYNVMYTSDLSIFNPVVDNTGSTKNFPANFDRNTVVVNEFRPPIHARYLKVLPLKWKDNIEMRVEPIGCFEPYPTSTTPPDVTIPEIECKLCPSVPAGVTSSCVCASADAPYYDGENCVPRDQCPCVESFMSYAVGAMFRGPNCDECVCKLGGITDCKPVKECKCPPYLVPILTSSCECDCSPCTNGTKICPTSKMCLPLEKWCDGLLDCPDDEVGCSTVAPTVVTTVEPTVVTTVAPTVAAVVTTPAPIIECPVVECPPGYVVRYTSTTSYSKPYTSDLPPPRRRVSYTRYRGSKGGFAKGGYSKGGFAKGGYSKGGYSKGGYGSHPASTPSFTLDKPTLTVKENTTKQECAQFKCVPKLPPYRPGSTPAPVVCSAPACPPHYTLKLDKVPHGPKQCPQYICVPPIERPVFCNLTGRTFSTFDGAEYKYDVCFHILARENRFDSWTVLVRKKCRVEGCVNELLVHQDDQVIQVKPNLMIEYQNYEYTVEQTSKICFQKNSFDVNKIGNGLAIQSRKYNFTVLYTTDGDVKIGVFKSHMGSVDGLCGAFDGDMSNDRSLPDGKLATNIEQFGRAWANPSMSPNACQTKVIPAEKQKRAWELCDVITKEPISQCGKVLNLDKWRSICLERICECTDLIKNGTKRTEEECRCQLLDQLVAACLAADQNVDISGWRMQRDCPADCPAPLVHYDCYRKRCEPTCSELGSTSTSCPAEDGQCFPGCYCPEGKLRKGDQCVSPHDCLDCTCHGTGTPAKYVTFEGDDLPFLGNCTYLASRDRNETGQHKYEVYATNGPCEEKSGITCTKAVHLIYEKNIIQITKDPVTKKLVTTLNKTPVFKYPLKKDWVTISLVNAQDISVVLPDVHVELTVEQTKMEFSVRVPSYVYGNQTEGLCGVCAGYQEHLLTSDGIPTDDFDLYGKSWQATAPVLTTLDIPPQEQCDDIPPTPECVPPPPDQNPCYNLLNADRFGRCHALIDPQPFVASCEADLCSNSSDVCSALAQYAAACRRQHVCLQWRTDLCPYLCEEPLVYRTCVDCELTCENNDELTKDPTKCDKLPVEGCFCPEGKVRVNNTCIEPAKCFPCDAKSEHYAGDEWQEDACTKCSCNKQDAGAHVSCTTQSCAAPVCGEQDDLITKPAAPGACCPQYLCVPKQLELHCEEPKKIECGFGQVLKQKTAPSGCKEFACECKPTSECEPIPSLKDVILEPGMERVVDHSGCCPKAQLFCNLSSCPEPPTCEQYYELIDQNVTSSCCPQYKCQPPKDKCIVTLEWEAASKGGEKARTKPQVVLKELDEAWVDGPCRSCRCESTPSGPAARCGITECAPVTSTDLFVLEPRPEPFACCVRPVYVACRELDNIYLPGQNWTSAHDVCESYQCAQTEDGKLEKITTVQTCPTDCEPGWKYVPAEEDSGKCCGKCKPFACVCEGVQHEVGATWTSPDHCTNYTCTNLNGTLQIQSSDETCPEATVAEQKQFVFNELKIPGKCCVSREPVACRVGDLIYQEGQSWQSDDPCKNLTCTRDGTGRLSKSVSAESCSVRSVADCKRGWAYLPPAPRTCCGQCQQAQCVVADDLMEPGSTWKSEDNCTTYSCDRIGEDVVVTSSRQSCPDVSACNPEDLVNETCCQVCVEKPSSLSTCTPQALPESESIAAVRVHMDRHGLCVNKEPLAGFKECRGTCDSGTIYNNQTGVHDSKCECCQAVKYSPLTVTLSCADGSTRLHRVASPALCSCLRCGAAAGGTPWLTTEATKTRYTTEEEYEIPQMYQRFGNTKPPRKP